MDAQEMSPRRLLEISGNYWLSCALHAAIRLEVFTVLGSEALTVAEVSQSIEAEGRGVTGLLNALTAMGLLEKRADRYANTPAAAEYLSKDSPKYLGHMMMLYHLMADSWLRLDQAVKSGKPIRIKPSHSDPEFRENFLLGMYTLAMDLAPRVAGRIDLSGRRRLLDLGGGPGTYAIHFCLKNPRLEATVYDLPTSGDVAQRTIAQFGLRDRVRFKGGNYLTEAVEGSYDVVWLSQVLHVEGPEDCRDLIQKAVSALEPGGMIIVHDMIMDDAMDGPLLPALFSLNMLLLTPGGRSYSEGQVREMLQQAGVKDIERLDFSGPHQSGIITGVV